MDLTALLPVVGDVVRLLQLGTELQFMEIYIPKSREGSGPGETNLPEERFGDVCVLGELRKQARAREINVLIEDESLPLIRWMRTGMRADFSTVSITPWCQAFRFMDKTERSNSTSETSDTDTTDSETTSSETNGPDVTVPSAL